MPSLNLIPLATTGNDQCIKCSGSISTNKFSLYCQTCRQCNVCSKKIAENHKAMLCNLCNCLVHIRCNHLTRDDYEVFKNSPHLNFTCLQCNSATFPFMSLNNDQFNTYITKGVLLNEDSDLSINPSPKLLWIK